MLIQSHHLTREDLRFIGSSDPFLRREVAKRRRPHRHPTDTVAAWTALETVKPSASPRQKLVN